MMMTDDGAESPYCASYLDGVFVIIEAGRLIIMLHRSLVTE